MKDKKKKNEIKCKALRTFAKLVDEKHREGYHPFAIVFMRPGEKTDDIIFCSHDDDHPVSQAMDAAISMIAGPVLEVERFNDSE